MQVTHIGSGTLSEHKNMQCCGCTCSAHVADRGRLPANASHVFVQSVMELLYLPVSPQAGLARATCGTAMHAARHHHRRRMLETGESTWSSKANVSGQIEVNEPMIAGKGDPRSLSHHAKNSHSHRRRRIAPTTAHDRARCAARARCLDAPHSRPAQPEEGGAPHTSEASEGCLPWMPAAIACPHFSPSFRHRCAPRRRLV